MIHDYCKGYKKLENGRYGIRKSANIRGKGG